MRTLTLFSAASLLIVLTGCEEEGAHADWAMDSGLSMEVERGVGLAAPEAKGALACGQQQVIVTNGLEQTQNCTIDYSNTCGDATALKSVMGNRVGLSETQNGGTSRVVYAVAAGDTITLDCCQGPDKGAKCTYEVISCVVVAEPAGDAGR